MYYKYNELSLHHLIPLCQGDLPGLIVTTESTWTVEDQSLLTILLCKVRHWS